MKVRTFSILCAVFFAWAALAADEEPKAGRARPQLSLELIEQTLTGNLALKSEQRATLADSYDKNLKPARDKFNGAKDAKERHELVAEFRAATQKFRKTVDATLSADQLKKVNDAVAPPPSRGIKRDKERPAPKTNDAK